MFCHGRPLGRIRGEGIAIGKQRSTAGLVLKRSPGNQPFPSSRVTQHQAIPSHVNHIQHGAIATDIPNRPALREFGIRPAKQANAIAGGQRDIIGTVALTVSGFDNKPIFTDLPHVPPARTNGQADIVCLGICWRAHGDAEA